jgi:hypothetical protein
MKLWYHGKHLEKVAMQKKICPVDGVEFIAHRSDAIYCSNRCRTRALRTRQATRSTQQLHVERMRLEVFMYAVPAEYAEILKMLENEYGFDAAFDTARMLSKVIKIDF